MSFARYPEYKDSGVAWLGEVPGHWEVLRLKNVLAQKVTDGPHTTPVFVDEGIPFLSVDGIQSGELVFDGCRFVSETDHDEFKRKAQPQRGDLLMGKAASTGKIARVKVDFDFSIWSPLALIRINDKEALPEFVEYVLKSNATQAEIDNYCTANTQKNISMDDIPRLILTRPPISEQTAIATFLDHETAKIDALVAEQQKLIALLQEKRQAVISHAVTKGLDPSVPMKDSGVEWLGEVPRHWEVSPLKRFWLVTDCKHVTAEFAEEGYPLASIREVQGRWVDLSSAKRTTEDFYRVLIEGGRLPEPGDLIFSRNATVGEVAQVNADHPLFAMGQDVVLLRRIEREYSPDFLQAVIRSDIVRVQLENLMIGSTFKRINVEEIRSILLPFPPPTEQAAIVEQLQNALYPLDALDAEAQEIIELLQERRTALISAAVTGQIDVRGLAASTLLFQ